jgi:hypothetical protein
MQKGIGDQIQVIYQKAESTPDASATTAQKTDNAVAKIFNAGTGNIVAEWYVQYQTDLITVNKEIKADGFSSVIMENIGEDTATLWNGLPLSPKDSRREFLNRPGEIITSSIPLKFANESANKQVLVTKIYYERVKQ